MDKFLKSLNKSQVISKSKLNQIDSIQLLTQEHLPKPNEISNKHIDRLDSILKEISDNQEGLYHNDVSKKFDDFFEDIKKNTYSVDSEQKLEIIYVKISFIYKKLIEIYNNTVSLEGYEQFVNYLIDFFEKSFYLFIFYFHSKFEYLAFEIMSTLLGSLDYQFHLELLQKFIDLIKLLMSKRQLNLLLCNRFIFNLSLAVNLTLHYSNEETRRFFLNSVVNNNEALMTAYFVCSATNNQFNFSKFIPIDILTNFTDRLNKDLEKQMNQFEVLINDLNKQKTSSLNNRIKQVLNSISSIAKVIDSFLVRGSRTFNYSKIIANLGKLMKNLWELLLIADIQVTLPIK
jgi:hypothetical protein